MKKILAFLVPCTVVMMAITACNDDAKKPGYEYMPNMYRSPSYETYSGNPNFPDSMTARQPVAGTIARGDNAIYTSFDRMPYPYPNTPEGYEAAGAQLHNPLPKDSLNMAEGKRLFENYCMICHGETGMGNGPVAERNGPRPPAYSSDLLKSLPEGKMFHTTEYGKNMMGSHASQLTATQRWKIIMYVQTMQQAVAVADTAKAAPKM